MEVDCAWQDLFGVYDVLYPFGHFKRVEWVHTLCVCVCVSTQLVLITPPRTQILLYLYFPIMYKYKENHLAHVDFRSLGIFNSNCKTIQIAGWGKRNILPPLSRLQTLKWRGGLNPHPTILNVIIFCCTMDALQVVFRVINPPDAFWKINTASENFFLHLRWLQTNFLISAPNSTEDGNMPCPVATFKEPLWKPTCCPREIPR